MGTPGSSSIGLSFKSLRPGKISTSLTTPGGSLAAINSSCLVFNSSLILSKRVCKAGLALREA